MINEKNTFMPYVVERTAAGERSYDLPSRLLEDRIIFLTGEINDATANAIIAQLIYLEGKDPTKDISLYISLFAFKNAKSLVITMSLLI